MIRRLFRGLMVIVLASVCAVAFVAWKQHAALEQALAVQEPQLLLVQPGDTPSGLFQRLEADGIIDDAFWLRVYWRLKLQDATLHSGEYQLVPGTTVRELLGAWQRGDVVRYNLTIIEGWTFKQLLAALEAEPKLEHTLKGLTSEQIMERLGHPSLHPEGRFYPDTYSFTRGTADFDILRRAFERLESVLAEEWARRAEGLPYDDAYQALVMASIIEKETGVPHERSMIAGVFVRRLEKGMLLQTDPTVIYGLGSSYDGTLNRAQLRQPTPYNTYVKPGLPPTPIALVGRAAIHAALHPADGESLYFVARGDGSHVFSATLREHNRAVRQFQLNRRADYRSSPPPSQSNAGKP
ncbi:endolytic transglycosylase MltG [Stutzerimonas urumqiensis]|uniref:endolytic transglycosylase MltG n=1 Tax=Stutzerimonas urumqiensis TaxID=638269 RepID=UPI000EAB857F|nr:endolytic transglycosylase MltG [Stutzerimonas urumqiensis]